MERKSHNSPFLPVLLVFSAVALVVVYFTLKANPPPSGHEPIASVAGYNLGTSGIEPAMREKLLQLDASRYELLSRQAETWIENSIIEREAKARGTTPEALLRELADAAPVTDADVKAVYLGDASFDSLPYETALKTIRDKLVQKAAADARRKYTNGLYAKYRARVYVKPPAGFVAQEAPAQPKIGPHPAKDDLAGGQVVGAPLMGKRDAPVVLEIFSDFMCPYSARFAAVVDQLVSAYPDKLRAEYRHFPLSFHKGADLMAEASACAQEQGKFWEYHDALFAAQQSNTPEALKGIAGQLGLDQARFDACLSGRKYTQWVQANLQEGASRQVKGTPGFFLNGRPGGGAMPFEAMKSRVDWHLNPSGAYPGAPQPGKKKPPAPAPAAPLPAEAPGGPVVKVSFTAEELKDLPSKGPVKAPVTLVEFIDWRCGFCKTGTANIDRLLAKYGDKLRLLSAQFPLNESTEALAMAAGCAHKAGRYWEFRAGVFGVDSTFDGSMKAILDLADSSGMGKDKMKACLDGLETAEWMKKQKQLGVEKGVKGTPTYFVNGIKMEGAQPVENFEPVIDSAVKP